MATIVAPIRPQSEISRPPPPSSGRLVYLDNLKILLVAGVIAAHASTYYIGGSRWLHQKGTVGSALITVLGAVGLAGALFWIGLFFLIAGLLAPDSLARHGPRRFLRDRMLRLGMPLAAYVFLVMPLLHYVSYGATYSGKGRPESLWTWLTTGGWYWDAGPLWFVADLLLFSAVYAAWWQLRPPPDEPSRPLRFCYLAGLAAAIAAGCFLIHVVWPLFTRQFLDLHLSEYPQYILLFWFGTVSARHGWLRALPDRLWRQCGEMALAAAVAVPIVGVLGGALSGDTSLIRGGWHWEALAAAGIEGSLAVAGCLWILDYFRRSQNHQWPLGKPLTRSSYAAYIVHQPYLIAFALILDPLNLPVEVNVLILAPALVVISFAT
ncbi:MAG TPA: acyltransferase, partial [Chloroflexota bacterium]